MATATKLAAQKQTATNAGCFGGIEIRMVKYSRARNYAAFAKKVNRSASYADAK